MLTSQLEYDIACEWGEQGIAALAARAEAIVIVDILSFSTCVDVALARGASVLPLRYGDAEAAEYARRYTAVLAGKRAARGYSLSPASLAQIPAGTRLVLPSPNGAALTLLAACYGATFTACLRDSQTVADYLSARYTRIAVIPAGERWPDGRLRPALEDLLGAGALISRLNGRKSPEALCAEAVYRSDTTTIAESVLRCVSGVELSARGFEIDVAMAVAENTSTVVPYYHQDRYSDAAHSGWDSHR